MNRKADPTPALERTAREYAAVPYHSRPFAHSHPARTGAIARLLGIDPPAVETARVLELGCASGGNLIPIAAHFPQARCLGIDVAQTHVDQGQVRIAALGLENVELRCASISDLGPELGEFDYIVAHGVYCWVPGAVREALLRVFGQSLAPQGIAYLSYNVLPGWRQNQPIRDSILGLVPEQLDPAHRIALARHVLTMMSEHMLDTSEYGSYLSRYAKSLLERPEALLFHDYMEPENEPFTVSQVLGDAQLHGLVYLADAEFSSSFPENFGEPFARELAKRSGGNILAREQMFDILSGRTFRRTLLVRDAAAKQITRVASSDRLTGMHLMLSPVATVTFESDAVHTDNGQGMRMTAQGTEAAKALRVLLQGSPGSVPFETCLAGHKPDERAEAAAILSSLVTNSTLFAALAPMEAVPASLMPRATRMARGDAASGQPHTANSRHEPVSINPVSAVLLPALDGTSDPQALAELLAQAVGEGRLEIEDPGDPQMLVASILAAVPDLLGELAGKGLLEA